MQKSVKLQQDEEHIGTTLVRIFVQKKGSEMYTLRETIKRSGVPRRMWLRYWLQGLAHPEGIFDNLQSRFDDDAIARIRLAERIRGETSGSLQSSAIIVKLLERIEKLEKELDFYR